MPDQRPPTLRGWPVRWERRMQIEDGDFTRGGLTAVVDGARLERPCLHMIIHGHGSYVQVRGDDLDGQPLDCLDDLALDLASDLVSARLVP